MIKNIFDILVLFHNLLRFNSNCQTSASKGSFVILRGKEHSFRVLGILKSFLVNIGEGLTKTYAENKTFRFSKFLFHLSRVKDLIDCASNGSKATFCLTKYEIKATTHPSLLLLSNKGTVTFIGYLATMKK